MTKPNTFVYPQLSTEVVVTSEATVAVVTAVVEGQTYTWTGVAKVYPGDKPKREIGIKLAVSRALSRAAKQLAKQAEGEVKNIDDNASREKTPAPQFHTVQARRRNRAVAQAKTTN